MDLMRWLLLKEKEGCWYNLRMEGTLSLFYVVNL